VHISRTPTATVQCLFSALKTENNINSPQEKRALRRVFGPREEVVGGWGRLHNEELHNLCSSLNIIKVIKSRSM
jgi:hypothetical protein